MPQTPSNGRIVHYTPDSSGSDQEMATYDTSPMTALVTYVHQDDRYLNLTVFDHAGVPWPRKTIPCEPEEPTAQRVGGRWHWPAFVPPKP